MYIIELVDRQSLMKIKDIEIVNEPTLNEEINAAYTFEFEAHYKAKSDFHSNNLVKVEGQYFQIVRAVKSRQNTISLSVQCEHVSYELIDEEDGIEEYEDTAQGMLTSILSGTRFTLGSCINTIPQYYKPSTLEVRQRLIDITHLFGGELIFDNFTVHLVPQRGNNKGLKVELGINLLGVTEEIDYVEGTTAYEIDLVDLAEISDYELNFSSAEIGDTIEIIDSELGIHTSERILSIQRNPFKPQLPTLTVGDYIRDFTEYIKEEKEDKEKEDDKGLLAQFKVGKIDCLALEDRIDAKSAVLDYIKDTSLQGVIPSADVELTENQTGVFASLKSDYSSYKLTAIITTETDSGLTSNFYELPNPTVSSLVLPQKNISVSVTLVITKVPFADLVNGKVPVVEDGENATFLEAYGVRFLINDNADGFLEDFKVGTVDALTFDDIECTDAVKAYIKGQKPNPHATWEYETEKLKGIYASLKEQYKNHHLTFIHTKIAAGKTTTEVRKMPFANARIMEIPTAKDDSVIMVITKDPFESLTTTNVDKSFIKAFGIRFKLARDFFLEEFRIGETDYLLDEGIEVEKDELASINTEIEYAAKTEFTGLFLKLKSTYSDYTISIKEYTKSGSTVHQYTDAYKSKELPGNLTALTITVSKGDEKQLFGVKFVKKEGAEPVERLYLEFGTCSLADTMTLTFENGPYDEIKSIATGFTGYGFLTSDITISVEPNEIDGKITSLSAYATNTDAAVTVNFQAVCMKLEGGYLDD